MSIRMVPPGRISQARTSLVMASGPHHFATWAGSVHATKTRSRGARITLVMTMCSGAVMGCCFSGVMAFFCFLKFRHVGIKAVESLFPNGAVGLSPAGHVSDRRRPQAAEVAAPLAALLNQARPHEVGEVL